jgi:hypothetical protein
MNRFKQMATVALFAGYACTSMPALATPVIIDFEEIDNTITSSNYWLPFGSSYEGKGFRISDLNSYGTPPQQGVLFTYFPSGYVQTYGTPYPFKSADSDGKSLFPQYSGAAISITKIDGSSFNFTSLKFAGFFDQTGEFTNCPAGPATCGLQLEVQFLSHRTSLYDVSLDNVEGFEKWAYNLDDVISVTIRQTTQDLAGGIGGWSYQFDDIILSGNFDPVPYESFAVTSGIQSIPEPTTILLRNLQNPIKRAELVDKTAKKKQITCPV